MAAANQSTRGSERSCAVSEELEYKEAQDCHQSELVVTLAKYRQLEDELASVTADLEFRRELGALQQQEYDKVTAERDALKADLCAFAVDMERQLSASQQEARRLREALQRAMDEYDNGGKCWHSNEVAGAMRAALA